MRHALLMLSLLLAAGPYPRQEQDPNPAQVEQRERDPALDADVIQARVAPLKAIPTEERTQDQADELLRLEGGLRALEQADVEWAKAAEFAATAQSAPDEIDKLTAKLAVPLEDGVPTMPEDVTLEELTAALQSSRTLLTAHQEELQGLERQVNDRTGRRQEILRLQPSTTEELRSLVGQVRLPEVWKNPGSESRAAAGRNGLVVSVLRQGTVARGSWAV